MLLLALPPSTTKEELRALSMGKPSLYAAFGYRFWPCTVVRVLCCSLNLLGLLKKEEKEEEKKINREGAECSFSLTRGE